jgi:AcrR family transcriptional regulator
MLIMATTTLSGLPAASRALRADARRNYKRLLCAARETFDEQGAHACLDEIARRAGVGIGTLYRHFPTRRDMVEAVLHDDIAALCAAAERLLAAPDAGEALARWLRAVAAHATASRGLAAELLRTSEAGLPPSGQCQEMRVLGARLLTRAQAAGEIRPDISADDLFTLINGLALVSDAGDQESTARLLDVMLDGLRRSREPAVGSRE